MQRKELKLSSAVSANSAVKKKNMEMKRKYDTRVTSHSAGRLTAESRIRAGSALILAVVLTSLLAIVGMMFVMTARVDRIATSAISENKTLDSAVEAVIARISQVLVSDVPGVAGAEYYDYPDANNAWLASLEPYEQAGNYYWRQISDVTGFLEDRGWDTEDIVINNDAIIEDHEEIELDSNGDIESSPEQLADADGDGVADSKWIELEGINSSKGKTIYAAIRVIDNGGMLNVNTAYQFNPASPGTDGEYIDGSDQMQINLLALAQRSALNTIEQLDEERFGSEPENIDNYIRDVIWRYNEPNGAYTPFDISDELELRNRFSLNRSDVDSRIEVVWTSSFRGPGYLRVPVDSNLSDWLEEVYYDLSEPNAYDNYSYRHIGTTYNMDRIINPYGGKMVNINRINPIAEPNITDLYNAIRMSFADVGVTNDPLAAQTAVNLKDFRDGASDPNVTTLGVNGITYYGFERPCVYISELAHRFVKIIPPGGPIVGGGIKPVIYRSYAIELYKPYSEDGDPNGWRLLIGRLPGGPLPLGGGEEYYINWSSSEQFYVIRNEDLMAPLPSIDPNAVLQPFGTLAFDGNDPIELQRYVTAVDDYITVDYIRVPRANAASRWLIPDFNAVAHSIQRDITRHKCIRRLWSSAGAPYSPTLGSNNSYSGGGLVIQAHPEDEDFTNVGEIGMVFRESAYGGIKPSDTEADVRINLADPNYHSLFRYLTVFDPTSDDIDNDGDIVEDACDVIGPEWKIPGRININTAPWYVIAQLPWMTETIAQAIVNHRDTQDGFESIGELMLVDEMHYYADDSNDLEGFPDLTAGDGAADDFEERDVIFARISNLVTVRSDVFTAYILVRIGADGPQKRVMAIFDRSNVYSDDGRVQLVALHPVADPR